jgi:hypothetical protein
VNDLGQIVGFYTDANDKVIGFVGTPTTTVPEPAALLLLLSGLILRKPFTASLLNKSE